MCIQRVGIKIIITRTIYLTVFPQFGRILQKLNISVPSCLPLHHHNTMGHLRVMPTEFCKDPCEQTGEKSLVICHYGPIHECGACNK